MEFAVLYLFPEKPGPDALDALTGSMETVCEIHGIQRPTCGMGPSSVLFPDIDIEDLERAIVAAEVEDVHPA